MEPREPHEPSAPLGENLANTIFEASMYMGQTRSFGQTTMAIDGTNLRQLFPDIPEGATHLGGMPTYERFDYSVHARQFPQADLSVGLMARSRYFTPEEATEPMRFSMGITNSQGSLLVEFAVPPTQNMSGQEPPYSPFAHVELSEGADIGRIISAAKDKLSLSAIDPDPSAQPLLGKTTPQMVECLDRLQALTASLGVQNGERNLLSEAQKALDELVNVYFYNTTNPHEEDSPTPEVGQTIPAPAEQLSPQAPKVEPSRVRGVRTIESRTSPNVPVGPYGAFAERMNYLDGLTVSKEMHTGAGVVGWKTVGEDGQRATYFIGKTPEELPSELSQGGESELIRRAGVPGEYLLTRLTRNGQGEADVVYRFLDDEDIDGLLIVPGEEVRFPYNHRRGRNLHLASGVRVRPSLVGYR